ncbi:MAG: CCA tRNA nucleotidyltransferase [Victivallaceae bacterium]|nr:CCA tRNA nucleotidyltransferase [Victivallaceae bacterium]
MKININNSSICKIAKEIVKKLHSAGHSAYFVGGAVRDMLLGRTPKDIDIVSSATPAETAEIFPDTLEVGASFGVMLVREQGVSFEVSTYREERNYMDGRRPGHVKYTDDPKIDVSRRDFTVNGLLCDPETGEVFDYVDGIKDLRQGVIRTIANAETRFGEDYLRMLRAVRFAARLGFELEADTLRAIQKLAPETVKLSAERIRQELTLIFTGETPDIALEMLHETGLLAALLPEIEAMRGVTQPPQFHPEGDVFEHTKLMLRSMALPDELIAWSVLLHDVAKPLTYFVDETGRERFFGHEQRGAEMAKDIMSRLRFSNQAIDRVSRAVKNHMRFASVPQMRKDKVKRLIADDNFPLELELHRLDCISSHALMDIFTFLLDKIVEQSGEVKLPPPLLTGKDLIDMGFKPGPKFKKILKKVSDLQLKNRLKTTEATIAYVKDKFLNS